MGEYVKKNDLSEKFHVVAQKMSNWVGSPYAFVFSTTTILLWGVSGPMFKFSDTWQLIINTSTTIITFLMVFLIQNTQNRDARAIHLKLDELIRASSHARNHLIDLQRLSDQELDSLHEELCLAQKITEDRVEDVKRVIEQKSKEEPSVDNT
jgi:low affinity Fe/Cu permease